MCGIFGFVGKKNNVGEMILAGLKTLEYRGYDSWGVAIKDGVQFRIEKDIGKINKAKLNFPDSNIGIGHTRWATHGGILVKNAHPLLDCTKKIALIHNGIIENFEELNKELKDLGHKFSSDTDTEVMVHMIEENLKTQNFETSVKRSFSRLKGLNAFVVLNSITSEIVAVKTGSPLVVGKGKDGLYISSDALGIIPHTKDLLFIKDREMVVLGKSLKLINLDDGKVLKPQFEKVGWKIDEENMGKFEHFMLKEIHDQPKVISSISSRVDEIEKIANLIKQSRGTFLIGAGTAYFACLAGVYFFSKISKRHINTSQASEFNYLEDFLTPQSLIIALSQSGETIDVVEPVMRAIKKGSKTIAITNVLGSSLYRMTEEKMLLGAGPEKAVASTKAYIAKLSVLLMMSFAITGNTKEAANLLEEASTEIDRILSQNKKIKKISKIVNKAENVYLIGRGFSFPSALEGALKIKEVSYVHSEGLAGGELKHGPIALISKGTPVVVFAPNDETYDAIISNAMEIKARGGMIIGISHKENSVFDHYIEVKDLNEATIIAQIVPVQLLAYYLAVLRGQDPDKPRNLAKSVTVR